jgi:hypothetical protein
VHLLPTAFYAAMQNETWIAVGSSHHNVETEAAKHDLNTSGTLKSADDPTLSDQTESENMKVITV